MKAVARYSVVSALRSIRVSLVQAAGLKTPNTSPTNEVCSMITVVRVKFISGIIDCGCRLSRNTRVASEM